MEKVITIIVAVIIAYAAITAKYPGRDQSLAESAVTKIQEAKDSLKAPEEYETKIEGNIAERTLSNVFLNMLKTPEGKEFMENLVRPQGAGLLDENYSFKINDPRLITQLFSIETIKEGEGKGAICSQSVEFINNGQKQDMILGQGDNIGLSNIIIGMKLGETRQAFIPPLYNSQNKGEAVKIELVGLGKSNLSPDKIQIFDDILAYKLPLLCGNEVKFNFNVKAIDGKILYQNKEPIIMKLGDPTWPELLSYILYNKIPVGRRIALAPAKYLAGFGGIEQKEEYIMLEFILD